MIIKKKNRPKTKFTMILQLNQKTMTLTSPTGKECVLKLGIEAKTDIITKEETI